MNVSSLCHNFDGLHSLLARMNIKSKIISTTETRLKNIVRNINTNLNEYAIKHISTEANSNYGGTLYIDNSLNSTVRNDLAIYKKKKF